MKLNAHVLWTTLLCAGVGMSSARAVAEQEYPSRPIVLVVPFAAGGPVDVMSRTAADSMSKLLGQPIVIENAVGAGGTIASARVARAKPDGYTLISGHMGTHAAAVALYPNLAYDPAKDFEPIGLLASTPVLVLARNNFPAQNLKEFVGYLRENASSLNMAHAGNGSSSHVTCLLLNHIVGAKPTMIPYSGTGPAMNALIGRQVDYMCDVGTNAVPQIRGGTIKAYAVATPMRNPALPELPTSAEAGLPDFDASSWVAIFAPKGTPQHIAQRLSAALDKASDDPNVRTRLTDLGNDIPEPSQRGPKPLADLVRSEMVKWSSVIGRAGVERP